MALGANLQRYSARNEQTKEEADRRPKLRQPLMLLGIAVFAVCGGILSLALMLAPQSLLSPTGIVIFVANALFAHYLNKEEFLWAEDGVCNLFVMVGITLCIVSAPKHESGQEGDVIRKCNNAAMLELMGTTTAISYLVFVALLVGTLLGLKSYFLKEVGVHWEQLNSFRLSLVNLSYGVVAGTLGGFNITLTKSLFALFHGQAEDDGFVGILSSWMIWLFSAILVGTFLFQLLTLSSGLEHCNALVVLPCQAVTEELCATLGGLLYFKDYTQFITWQAVVFGVGNLLTLGSVVVLVYLRVRRTPGGTSETWQQFEDATPSELDHQAGTPNGTDEEDGKWSRSQGWNPECTGSQMKRNCGATGSKS